MLTYITESYNYYIGNEQDPRTKGFPIMENPQTALILCSLYLIFVKFIGPAYMKDREPLNIKGIVVVYNAIQTLFSMNMFIWGCWIGAHVLTNTIFCSPVEYKTDYYSLQHIQISWLFMVARFTEFLDTVFFILRKKDNQVTTLHVVHHFTVPLICWVGVKIVPASHYTFAGLINAFVHTFMYLYYMIAAMGPEYKQYLWWKKYMTVLQLTQFIIVIAHTIVTLNSDCKVPKTFGYLILAQAVLFFALFWNFYLQAFQKTKLKKASKPIFNMEKYYQKYKKFFEMCIPNQHELFNEEDDIQGDPIEGNSLNIAEEHRKKEI